MNFNIHKANENEALKMNNLLTKLIQDERQYDSNIDASFKVSSFYEHYVDDPGRCLLVVTDNTEVIGYLYGYIKPLEGGIKGQISAKLDAIFVETEYRKQHIAQSLIDHFKTWCKEKGVTSLEVDVCSDNQKAINLYHQVGFEEFKKTLKMHLEQ